jgi:hypothetical protein
LPEGPKWRRVVQLLAEGAEVGAVGDATLTAAQRGLLRAAGDAGLRQAVQILTQVAIAARSNQFEAALAQSGIGVPTSADVFELAAAVSDSLDRQLDRPGARTDLGELARLAAIETLTSLGSASASSLFPEGPPLGTVYAPYSTKAGFARLAHSFFSAFISRYLAYHLSRELSQHVGQNQRFRDPSQHNQFLDALSVHGSQVALILREFAGGWYSKAVFKQKVSPRDIDGFTAYALTKIRQELEVRSARDDD